MVHIYRQKGYVMECGSYRLIKLMEHAMNALGRVVGKRFMTIVDIDGMQFVYRTLPRVSSTPSDSVSTPHLLFAHYTGYRSGCESSSRYAHVHVQSHSWLRA